MKNLKLSTKLALVCGLLSLVAVVIGVLGLVGIHRTNAGLETVYNDRVVPLKQLKIIADHYAVSIIDAVNKANAGLFDAQTALKGVDAASTEIRTQWNAYMATTLTVEEAKMAKEAQALFKAADADVARLREKLASTTGPLKGALADFDGPLYETIDPISGKISELVELQLRVANEEYVAAHQRFNVMLALSSTTLVLGVVFGAGFGIRTGREVSSTLQEVAASLAVGADQTTAAANEVAAGSQGLAEGASQQAASLEETSASIEEIASMTKRNAEHAANGATLGKAATDSADAGLSRLEDMGRTIATIKGAVQEMQQAVTQMQSSSQEVSKIIRTIDEIAFQTNLLALNAAVEAARAGEAGAGFAVVADEVRALAQRSAQAARDTSSKIEDAVRRSQSGGEASAKVARSLGEVEATAQSIQEVFNGIAAQVKGLDDVVSQIAAASREQSSGINEINMAVTQMDKVTQSNAATAEENAAASEELSSQARSLQSSIRRLEAVIQGAAAGEPDPAQPTSAPETEPPAISARPVVLQHRTESHGTVTLRQPNTSRVAEADVFEVASHN